MKIRKAYLYALAFSILLFFIVNITSANASTYLNNASLATSTFDGNTWITIISPTTGTIQNNPSSILFTGTSTTLDSFSPMGISGNIWVYPTGTRTRLNQAYTFNTWPNGFNTVVICTNFILPSNWCGFNISTTYPTKSQALNLSDTYFLEFDKTSTSLENQLPLDGQTRIISTLPQTGSIGSTTQLFTTNYENATPNATKICIVYQRQSNTTSYPPSSHCNNVVSSGLSSVSTTTKLILNASYLYKTELYTTSTNTPYTVSEIKYITIGSFQWSPLFTDATSTIIQNPTIFCDSLSGAEKQICRIVMYVWAIPVDLVKLVYSSMVTTIIQTPPVSWYFQIKTQFESIEFSKQTNQGFTMQTPFNTSVTFLTQNQLNTWTGGYLGTLRTLTTISLIIAYFIYLVNRVLFRIF